MLSEHNRCPPDPEPGEHRLHRVLAGRKLRRTVLPLDVGLDRDHRLLDLSTEVDEVEGDPRGRGGWKRGAALINEGRLPQDAWRRTTPAAAATCSIACSTFPNEADANPSFPSPHANGERVRREIP